MAQLTPNTNVGSMESMGASALGMLYKSYLRSLLIEKIDDPTHIYDDRILAACDGAAGLIQPYSGD